LRIARSVSRIAHSTDGATSAASSDVERNSPGASLSAPAFLLPPPQSARSSSFRRCIPCAPILETINQALLAQMDARLETGRDQTDETIGTRFAVEARREQRA
jgi:hypothetical protein